MARRIIWSRDAQKERQWILHYWAERTGTKTFSQKLNRLFNERLAQVKRFPEIGMETDHMGVYFLIIRDYLLFYQVTDLTINVLSVWDGRRNPQEKPFLNQ